MSSTKSRESRACPHPSCTLNQAGETSSVWYEDVRKENLSSSVRYKESIRLEFVRPVRSCAKGDLGLVRPVQGIKWKGLRLSDTTSREKRACPLPSGMRNQASVTLSILYKDACREGAFLSIRYNESSKRDFVRPVRSRAKGKHVHFRLV